MSILTEESLEFARVHIEKFYDSDFFPKAFEFLAIWYSWDDVKNEIMSKNISKIQIKPPKVLTSIKPKGGFRIVHQLDPLDAIIYTAMVYSVAEKIEGARIPMGEHKACSYRIQLNEGSFFLIIMDSLSSLINQKI